MSDVILSIDDMSAGYDQADVVRDLNMHVDAGEVVALFGPNGAGKTTTLRVVSGIIKPSGGSVSYLGEDLAKLSPTARARGGISHVQRVVGSSSDSPSRSTSDSAIAAK